VTACRNTSRSVWKGMAIEEARKLGAKVQGRKDTGLPA
jgi:hypothetical protein